MDRTRLALFAVGIYCGVWYTRYRALMAWKKFEAAVEDADLQAYAEQGIEELEEWLSNRLG